MINRPTFWTSVRYVSNNPIPQHSWTETFRNAADSYFSFGRQVVAFVDLDSNEKNIVLKEEKMGFLIRYRKAKIIQRSRH